MNANSSCQQGEWKKQQQVSVLISCEKVKLNRGGQAAAVASMCVKLLSITATGWEARNEEGVGSPHIILPTGPTPG